ncbi:hypothetical protein [Prosthecomicrobium sp. N25]|uniref:hypothetical protein n=1 Tax=Prosthecomicrobium sp. N25 TaxID=3129254 RepID=UPI003077DC7A
MTHTTLFRFAAAGLLATAVLGSGEASAQSQRRVPDGCPVTHADLKSALVTAAGQDSTGLNNDYWGVVVNRSGIVCAVAYSGPTVSSQWLLSRQIASAKAFTANGLSLDKAAVSTAALYPWVQSGAPANGAFPGFAPGNPLYGLNGGNVQAAGVYEGPSSQFGTPNDPMVGLRVGGTITFGGGLGLYSGNTAVGGLGLSGDTACADHSTAFRVRALLNKAPGPSVGTAFDKIVLTTDASGHPHCPNDAGTMGQ